MAVPAESILRLALAQKGKPYVFGVEVALGDINPAAFDCSELVQWACKQAGVAPDMPDGTWFQQAHCKQRGTLVGVETGIDTRGALLFNHRDVAGNPVDDMALCPPTAHVAFSLGDGTTIEAMGTKWGICIGRATGRNWTHAARIPGADYSQGTPTVTTTATASTISTVGPSAGPPVSGGPPWMKVGSTGDDVRQLQQLLIDVGVDRIPKHEASGQFTDLTELAIRLVQEHVRSHYEPAMEVDGICGPITWGWVTFLADAKPGEAPPVGGPPTRSDVAAVRRGALGGDAVSTLQRALVAIGVRRIGELNPSGKFGTLTDIALRLFQWHVRSHHEPTMVVDGICGPVTWRWLTKLAAEARAAKS
jgi:peptidoglycan hydrolase-like protein with peptidoglycan-binding domain